MALFLTIKKRANNIRNDPPPTPLNKGGEERSVVILIRRMKQPCPFPPLPKGGPGGDGGRGASWYSLLEKSPYLTISKFHKNKNKNKNRGKGRRV